MSEGPSDSTLRRHFEQMESLRGSSTITPGMTAESVATKQPGSNTAESPPGTQKIGFFAWLSRLFGI